MRDIVLYSIDEIFPVGRLGFFNLVPKQINRFFLQKGSVFPLEKICAARYIISVSKS